LKNILKDVLYPRVTRLLPVKENFFSSPLFGIYIFFLFHILMSLKKNIRRLHYKGGTCVMGKKTIFKNMGDTEFSVQGDMCRIRTLGKILPWVKVSERKGKNTARLAPT
jgi:hypothetical protein